MKNNRKKGQIALGHVFFLKPWNKAWLYLGSNYLSLRKCEGLLEGRRVSLGIDIEKETEELRPDFLSWIEAQRKANNDSLYWWMTNIAGRSTTSSLFLHSCQLTAIKRWLRDRKDANDDVLIVCEDSFLLTAVENNCRNEFELDKIGLWWLGSINDCVHWITKAGYKIIRQLSHMFRRARLARITRPKNLAKPKGEVFLIHQTIDSDAFLQDGSLACRHLTVLPSWLESKGKQVVRLPWMVDRSLSRKENYRRLRQENCLIPEDWLNSKDLLVSIFRHCCAAFSIKKNISFSQLNLNSLVARERLQQFGNGGAEFWRYIPMLERWSQDLSSLIWIDHFEGMVHEHAQIYMGRRLPIKFLAISHYHSLVTRDFLPYHFPRDEWSSQVMPDIVVTNGSLSKQVLINQGAPPERIIAGPALRQGSYFNRQQSKKGNSLVILTALNMLSAVELIEAVFQHQEWLRDTLSCNIKIKLHPFMQSDYLYRQLGWEKLPSGWERVKGPIALATEDSLCALGISTASIIDAVLHGCYVVSIRQELDAPFNYLDHLQDEFEILRPISRNRIPAKLGEIFFSKREYYNKEFEKIRNKLLEGLNPISDNTLQSFIQNVN